MSDHAIEDFTEYFVEQVQKTAISKTEKRQLFYNLYRFQNFFDSSYTVLHCFKILNENNFIQKLPIERHPDFNSQEQYFEDFDFENDSWFPFDVSAEDEGMVYVLKEPDGIFLFPEFGSKIWERIFPDDEKAEVLTVPKLFVHLFSLAKKAGDELQLKQLYAALIYGFFQGVETAEYGFPTDFSDWLKDADLLALRSFFIDFDLLKIKKGDSFFEPSSLNEFLEYASEKQEAKIRFLMDPQKSLEQLEKLWLKANAPKEDVTSKIQLIQTVMGEGLQSNGWQFYTQFVREDFGDYYFIWHKETASLHNKIRDFQFLVSVYDPGLKSVIVSQLVQHSLIQKWQNHQPDFNYRNAHFKKELFHLLSDAQQNSLDKKFNYLGGWRFDLKKSEKVLTKSLRELTEIILSTEDKMMDWINNNFPDKFLQKTAAQYVNLFDEMLMAPDDLMFDSLRENLLLLIYDAAQKDDFKKAKSIAKILMDRLPQSYQEQSAFYLNEVLPFLNKILNNEKPHLPQLREWR